MLSSVSWLSVIVTFLAAIAATAQAQEPRFGIGVGIAIDAADGEPANDIPGVGVLARYRLNDQWAIGAAVNRTEYDYETPAEIVGITQDPTVEVIDALAEGTTIRAWAERSLDRCEPTDTFLSGRRPSGGVHRRAGCCRSASGRRPF